MKSSIDQSLKCGNDDEKSKSQREATTNVGHRIRGNPLTKDKHSIESVPSLQEGRALHSAEAPHQRNLQCHQRPVMGKAPEAVSIRPYTSQGERICPYHDSKAHRTIHYKAFKNTWKNLSCQVFFKEFILTPWTASDAEQSSAPPPNQLQHIITPSTT